MLAPHSDISMTVIVNAFIVFVCLNRFCTSKLNLVFANIKKK